jgi:hypothetical protein
MKLSIQKYLFLLAIMLFGAFIVLALPACQDEKFSSNPNHRLSFSLDTLSFDTVFTTIGSATSRIMVYNRNKRALNIEYIGLKHKGNSSFRLNVDGRIDAEQQFHNVEISANDSLYIFAEVTVDPTNVNSPVLIEDILSFRTNGVEQKLVFQAFGQDMELIKGNKHILNDTILSAEKPYLINGILSVEQGKTLTIPAGSKFYFHNNSYLIAFGNINADGTRENPILMRGDRLDKIMLDTPIPYNYVAGQWGGIHLYAGEGEHLFNYVNINSGDVGIYLRNENKNKRPKITISNCKIHNSLIYGLLLMNADAEVVNSEISNSSMQTVYLDGGSHTFIHCTIANYFNSGNANIQSESRSSDYPAVTIMDLTHSAPMNSNFLNCIISGSYENEFSLVTRFPEQYKGVFKNSYIRRGRPIETGQFESIRWYEKGDTLFVNTSADYVENNYYDFQLDSVSPARNIADMEIAKKYPLDMNGVNRIADGTPDAGAYQWTPAINKEE